MFVDGKDETANFTIAIDRKAGTATATAKSAYIAKTMFRNSASKVRFYLTGTIKKGATEGKKIQLTNKAYEKWNNETRPPTSRRCSCGRQPQQGVGHEG